MEQKDERGLHGEEEVAAEFGGRMTRQGPGRMAETGNMSKDAGAVNIHHVPWARV